MVSSWKKKFRPLAALAEPADPEHEERMLKEQEPSDVWNVFLSLNLKRRLGLTASVNRYSSTGKTSNQDEISSIVFSAVWYPIPWYRKGIEIRLKQIQPKKNRLRKTLVAKPCSRSLKVREEIQMGNTHPLNHVPLYWLSAAPGLKPGIVRLRSL